MVRAYRYFLPGYTWHLTQRCHKREFLLKFARDRRRWRKWLFQAKKRYGLRVLNYMVTSNHIHLLVYDDGRKNVIPRSMQLISGRVGQEYNQRKSRDGSFWGDRYHATVVERRKMEIVLRKKPGDFFLLFFFFLFFLSFLSAFLFSCVLLSYVFSHVLFSCVLFHGWIRQSQDYICVLLYISRLSSVIKSDLVLCSLSLPN